MASILGLVWRGTAVSALALTLAACNQSAVPPHAETHSEPETSVAAEPAARSFSASGLAAFDARLTELAAANDRAGFVAVLARDGKVQHVSRAGYADLAAGREMSADTIVRIASMTKPVTAAAIMMLVEDGALSLSDPVSDYIPAFAASRVATSTQRNGEDIIPTEALARPITIEDLLTHTSGIGYVFDYQTNLGALYIGNDIYQGEGDMDARMQTLASLPLYFQPGAAWYYSFSNDVLGHVVAVASGQSLEDFLQTRLFGPLGMADSTFFLRDEQRDRLSALYTHGEDGALSVVPVDEDAVSVAPFEAGGAGLFSTANDYLRFAQMLANGGALDGVRVLTEASVSAMTEPHVQADRTPDPMDGMDMGFGYSLGVIYDGPGEHPHRRPGDFGWGGYFDTEFVVSPSTGLVAVIMAQELPGATTGETVGARGVFDELVYGALPTES